MKTKPQQNTLSRDRHEAISFIRLVLSRKPYHQMGKKELAVCVKYSDQTLIDLAGEIEDAMGSPAGQAFIAKSPDVLLAYLAFSKRLRAAAAKMSKAVPAGCVALVSAADLFAVA